MAAGRRHTTTPSAFDVLSRDRKLSAADKKGIKLAALSAIDRFLAGAGIKDPSKLAEALEKARETLAGQVGA